MAGIVRGENLAGTWRVRLDEADVGLRQHWENAAAGWEGAPTMRLPGSTDESHLGRRNTAAPTLDGLYRPWSFTGPAWYCREVTSTATSGEWRLYLERAHGLTRAWLDGVEIGTEQESLIAPHVHRGGPPVAPGRHRLVIRSDNRLRFDLGRFVSISYEGTQTNWNGLIGRLELDPDGAVPEMPPAMNPPRRLTIDGTHFAVDGHRIQLRGTVDCAIYPLTGYPPMDLPSWRRMFAVYRAYGFNHVRFHSWCPPEAAFAAADEAGFLLQVEAPEANIALGRNPERDAFVGREIRRILTTYGHHPSFAFLSMGNELKGANSVAARWVAECERADPRHLYTCSTYGFGILTENRQYTVQSKPRGIHEEGTDDDYRAVLAPDPRPVISHEVGQWTFYPHLAEESKYTGVLQADNFNLVRAGLAAHGLEGLADRFFRATGEQAVRLYRAEMETILRTPNSPGFQLLALQDYPGQGTALIGPLDPFLDSKGLVTPEEWRESCAPVVVLARLPRRTFFADERAEVSFEVSDFENDGLRQPTSHPSRRYVRWSLVPAAPEGPAPAKSRADAPNASDFQPRAPDGRPTSSREAPIAAGRLPTADYPDDALSDAGRAVLDFAPIQSPAHVTLRACLLAEAGERLVARNDWDLWIYPRPRSADLAWPEGVAVVHHWDGGAAARLSAGGTVLYLGGSDAPRSRPGSFTPVFWSPVWFHREPATMGILCDPHHPALAGFPTDFFSDWQWYDLQNRSRTLSLEGAPPGFTPIVRVIDNFSRNLPLANLFEAKVGNGRLLVCGIDLEAGIAQRPAASQLRRSLARYLAGPMSPATPELTSLQVEHLLH